jgi:hypothetical protein
MARVAQLLEETVECDFVDINMGCPIGQDLLLRPSTMRSSPLKLPGSFCIFKEDRNFFFSVKL